MKIKIFALVFTLLFACIFLSLVYLTFSLVYPVKYLEQIKPYSHKYNVSTPLVLGVIKAESSFNEKTISSAGACGLMQLMPTTAEYIASKISYSKKIDLFDPNCNIALGVAYISYLQNRFSDLDSVICAYNAGENVVKNWQRNENGLLIIEYKETEQYLQNVKKALCIYNKKVL